MMMKLIIASTTGSKPDAMRMGNTVKLKIRRKNSMKFTDSQMTRAGAGLNGWFKEKWLLETIIHRNSVSTGRKKGWEYRVEVKGIKI